MGCPILVVHEIGRGIGDAACSQVTVGNLVKFVGQTRSESLWGIHQSFCCLTQLHNLLSKWTCFFGILFVSLEWVGWLLKIDN